MGEKYAQEMVNEKMKDVRGEPFGYMEPHVLMNMTVVRDRREVARVIIT